MEKKEGWIIKISDSLTYGESSDHYNLLSSMLSKLIPRDEYESMTYEEIHLKYSRLEKEKENV